MIIHAIRNTLRQGSRNEKGFTLVEVIISIAALGIICAVLLRLFVLAGATNNQANDVQDAQIAVTSAVEVLAASDTVYDALDALGISHSDSITAESFVCPKDGYNLIIDLAARGDYPGTLYDISVSAQADDKDLAAISTSTYYKEQTHD